MQTSKQQCDILEAQLEKHKVNEEQTTVAWG